MIDLHCHILPGIDDGAIDVADSIAMARQADSDGITTICATPHIRHDHGVRIHDLAERVDALNAALADAGCRARARTGGEVAEAVLGSHDDDELRLVTLGGGGRWLLLEPAPGPLSDAFESAVKTLTERGFRCVIAHPERHLTADLVARLARLIQLGALVQATAAHVIERGPSAGVRTLAQAGVIHLLATDAHSSRHGRPLRLSAALRSLAEIDLLRPHIAWIARAAPAAIIAGDDVEPPFAVRG